MTSNAKSPREKLKLALIPVLGIVLLYVLMAPEEGADPAAAVTLSASPPASPAAASPVELPQATPPKQSRSQWPQLALEQILDHNPFAFPIELVPTVPTSTADLPPAEPDPVLEEPEEPETDFRQELLKQLQATPIAAYYQSKQGAVAMVGDRLLREGDVIEEAVEVQQILPDRIVYRLLPP